MTKLEDAKAALAEFEKSVDAGYPWLPDSMFVDNPELVGHILGALHEFVRIQRAHEQSKPAKRVSLTEVADGKDADQGQA